jgi:hypothetical protein
MRNRTLPGTLLRACGLLTLVGLVACDTIDDTTAPVIPIAGQSALTLLGPSVQKKVHPVSETGRFLVEGQRTATGGCSFRLETRIRPGGEPRIERIAEYDPDTCQFIVATYEWRAFAAWYRDTRGDTLRHESRFKGRKSDGAPAGISSPALSSHEYTEMSTEHEVQHQSGGGGSAAPSRAHGEGCAPTIGWDETAWQTIITEDPVNINTSESHHDIFYFYQDGVCVNYVRSLLLSKVLSFSGWEIQTHYHPDPEPLSSEWRAVATMPFQVMRNTSFAPQYCITQPGAGNTYTYYRNWLTAWYDGYTSYLWEGYSEGGCASWLDTWRVYG